VDNGDICGYVWGQTKIRIEIPIENEKNIDLVNLENI
jgi:hypothetical protein